MEIKKIILNGCSYTHGADLTFEKYKVPKFNNFFEVSEKWSKDQWDEFNSFNLAGQLKSSLGCKEVVNLALPGYSNEYIASKTIDYIEQNWKDIDPKTTLVMIGWTEFCRTQIVSESMGIFNFSIPFIDSYINVFTEEHPKTKSLLERLKLLKRLDPLREYYISDVYCTTTDYFRHINLILMLQFYLQSKGLNFLFWNSLINCPRMPFKDSNNPVTYSNIENLVDWSKWSPNFNKNSYERSWEEMIRKDLKYRTFSSHPSIEGVRIWADVLSDNIKLLY